MGYFVLWFDIRDYFMFMVKKLRILVILFSFYNNDDFYMIILLFSVFR